MLKWHIAKKTNILQLWPNFCPKRPNFSHIRIFPAYRIWFSQRRPQDSIPYKKIWKFIAAFERYRPKRAKNGNFGQKWQNFGNIRIFPAYRILFSQRTPQYFFHIKNITKYIAAFKKNKNVNFGQKKIDHFFSGH